MKIKIFSLLLFSLFSFALSANHSQSNDMNYPLDFSQYVSPPDGNIELFKAEGDTKDILRGIKSMDEEDVSYLKNLVAQFKDGKEGLRDFHDFLIYHVQYVADDDGEQLIKAPNRLLYEGEGDCKSYSIAIGAFCKIKGIEYEYEATSYKMLNMRKTHIYTVAKINNQRIPIDPVWTIFQAVEGRVANLDYQRHLATLNNRFGTRKWYWHRTVMSGDTAKVGTIKNNNFFVDTAIVATASYLTFKALQWGVKKVRS